MELIVKTILIDMNHHIHFIQQKAEGWVEELALVPLKEMKKLCSELRSLALHPQSLHRNRLPSGMKTAYVHHRDASQRLRDG